jgi:hypothetical protein
MGQIVYLQNFRARRQTRPETYAEAAQRLLERMDRIKKLAEANSSDCASSQNDG